MVTRSLGRLAVAVGVLFLLGACTTQPVAMKKEFWSQTDRSVTVALAKLPETAAHKVGQQGLIDVAISNAVTEDLSKAPINFATFPTAPLAARKAS